MKHVFENINYKPNWFFLLGLTLLLPLVYFNVFNAGFVSWDDGDVLLKNKDVHSFNVQAFFTKQYVGNYAPITMLSFALDWILFHGNAFFHHLVNVLIHLANTYLVFYLSLRLFKDKLIAFISALVFCIHPLQMETVAWISAKNNLLYSFFFLSGMLCYTKYITTNTKRYYIYTFFLFIISVLSKPSAVVFPLCLVILDYLLQEKLIIKKLVIDKIPFIVIASTLGIVTMYTRTEANFITDNHAPAFYQKIGYAGYAILQYVYRFLCPVNLSVIYPYPQYEMLSISLGYTVILVIITSVYFMSKSKNKHILFGALFFICNLLLVLQLIPFGETLTTDRYMYLPIVGLCWSFLFITKLNNQKLIVLCGILVIYFGILSFNRASVWKNSISLYGDILKSYPNSHEALTSLGSEYMLTRNYGLAEKYLNKAVSENKAHYKGYYNRGLLYAQTNRMNQALSDFTKAIELNQYTKAYIARANVYYIIKDFPKAIKDAETVLSKDLKNARANYVLATCYDDLNQLDKALNYYNKAILCDSEDPLYYLRRAILFGKQQKLEDALIDLNTCTTLNPKFGEAYYWMGVVKVNLNQNPCQQFKLAYEFGFEMAKKPLLNYCK